MKFKYDSNPKNVVIHATPDSKKEQTIKEIFNLSSASAPTEKHLEPQMNPLKAWGHKKPR